MNKRPNDVPHRRAFKQATGRSPKAGYHIHHIDGNWANNDPTNLQELTPLEHYQVHKSQGDWYACMRLAPLTQISLEEIKQIQHLHGQRCVEKKVGIHSDNWDGAAHRAKIWKESPPGRKPVTDGVRVLKLQTDHDVATFLADNPLWRRGVPEKMRQGLLQNKRRITSAEAVQLAHRRLKENNHNFTTLHKCPHCGKEGKGPMMFRWHFDKCKDKV